MVQGIPGLGPLKNYVELASGLTEVTANKAKEVAMALLAQGLSLGTKQPADVAATVQQAADDLLTLSKTNRDMLIDIIRSEVDKAVGRMGFVREDELAAMRSRVDRLEKELAGTNNTATTTPAKKKKVIVSE